MNSIGLFLFKSTLVSGILILLYVLLLRNKRMYNYNRFFLLFTLYASIQVPLLHFNWFTIPAQTAKAGSSTAFLRIVSGTDSAEPYMKGYAPYYSINWGTVLLYSMALVSLVLLVILAIRVIWLIRMSKKYPATEMLGVKIIHSDLKKTPFSFLNYLFWKESIPLSSASGQLVLQHELTHIKQKHTYDKLACRLLGCILWPNPFYRLIGKELDMVHEFIADEQAVNGNDTDAFARMLLAAHDSTPHFGPEHHFFSSPIKRRLTMLQASSKTSFAIFRRIAVIPALAGILLLFSFNARTGTAGILRADTKIILVVDPGHGGMDRGAHYGSYVEKDIDLKIANRISELAAAHNVEVHLTRNDDSYPTLNQRVIFSNQLHPDYFMSVHVNDDTDNGAANYLANITYNQNYNGSMKLLGCVMKSLSEPLHVNFTDMRIKQPNLWVLKNNVAPAITLELGDIKNKQQMQLLTDDKKLDEICNAILNGVVVAHKE